MNTLGPMMRVWAFITISAYVTKNCMQVCSGSTEQHYDLTCCCQAVTGVQCIPWPPGQKVSLWTLRM